MGGVAGVMLYEPDGTGMGISTMLGQPRAQQVAELADQVQEWAVEALCAATMPAVWPECPAHPNAHPLAPVVLHGQAVWSCPRDGVTVALIGELAATLTTAADRRVEAEGGERRSARKRKRQPTRD